MYLAPTRFDYRPMITFSYAILFGGIRRAGLKLFSQQTQLIFQIVVDVFCSTIISKKLDVVASGGGHSLHKILEAVSGLIFVLEKIHSFVLAVYVLKRAYYWAPPTESTCMGSRSSDTIQSLTFS